MSDPIEAVARALCADLGLNPDDGWEKAPGVFVARWEREAESLHAALNAAGYVLQRRDDFDSGLAVGMLF